MEASELVSNLANFYGTEQWYRHGLNRNVLFTDGVKYFADTVGAYWLLDILATEPAILKEGAEFASVTLQVATDGKAHLTVTDGGKGGRKEKIVYERNISWTDCPPGKWEFFIEGNIILLPSEH